MKQGWKIMKLGEVCDIYAGQSAPQGDENYSSQGTPFIKAGNLEALTSGELESNIQQVSEGVAKSHKLVKYKKGSVVFAKSGMSCMKGYIYTLQGDCYVVSHLAILTPKQIESSYLNYCLQIYKPCSLAKEAAFPSITLKELSSFEVPVPTISEQQRIVDLLDAEFAKIDALKANAEKNLQNAKDLFQAALNKLIIGGSKGWKSTKLKTICSKIGSGATPLGGKSTYGKEGVSLIRSLNVHNNEFHYEDLAHINEEQAKQLSNVEIKENDVLFNITGASVTRCCKVPKNVLPARVNQHVSILRLLPYTLLPNFLVYTMISPHHNSALMKMAENGATRQAITKKQLEEWVIKYPETIADQQSIVSRLDTLSEKCKALQANYEKTLSLCDDLKQALLRKAFNGEI